MTTWLPDLSDGDGPLYLRLADQIEREIAEGRLPDGAKLPPQRNLAYDVGVTIGTVGRAYALLRERGLVSSEVGRGTYVRSPTQREAAAPVRPSASETPPPSRSETAAGWLLDTTAAPEVGQAEAIGRLVAEIVRDHPLEVSAYARRTPPTWTQAGQRWLSRGDWRPEPASVVPAPGGHAAVLAVIAAATTSGDRIAFEHLTYSQVARSADLIGRRSVAVAMDDEGMDPADLERVCAQRHPRLVFLMPDLHNPTLAAMPEGRRRDIVDVARRHNLWIVEDAIYGALLDATPPTLAELAPERTFHVGSLSKAVSAGVRGGWVACPPHLAPRVLTAGRMLCGMGPFLLNELSARLVVSGAADAIRERVTTEVAAREALARAAFADCDFAAHPHAPFLWMKLPEPWLPATFKQAAANEGILIEDEDQFKCGPGATNFQRVRIAFSAPDGRDRLAEGFARLRALIDSGIAGYDRYG